MNTYLLAPPKMAILESEMLRKAEKRKQRSEMGGGRNICLEVYLTHSLLPGCVLVCYRRYPAVGTPVESVCVRRAVAWRVSV